MPTLSTTVAVGDAQEDAGAYLRYYYMVSGPGDAAEVVPVTLTGYIRLFAEAGDTAQADSTGQIDLPTPFTSDFASLEIDRGGTVRGDVTSMNVLLHGSVYTNGWNSVVMRASSGARGSRYGGGRGSAFVDPVIGIDPSFFTGDHAGRESAYTLAFSPGIGDGALAGVPEPSAWAFMIVGFGAVGGSMRRRAKVRTNAGVA